jgi:hypothetical protein
MSTTFKSGTMKLYTSSEFESTRKQMAVLTEAELVFADEVYALAESRYEDGGDRVVECWEPWSVVDRLKTLADVREYMGLIKDREEDVRNA